MMDEGKGGFNTNNIRSVVSNFWSIGRTLASTMLLFLRNLYDSTLKMLSSFLTAIIIHDDNTDHQSHHTKIQAAAASAFLLLLGLLLFLAFLQRRRQQRLRQQSVDWVVPTILRNRTRTLSSAGDNAMMVVPHFMAQQLAARRNRTQHSTAAFFGGISGSSVDLLSPPLSRSRGNTTTTITLPSSPKNGGKTTTTMTHRSTTIVPDMSVDTFRDSEMHSTDYNDDMELISNELLEHVYAYEERRRMMAATPRSSGGGRKMTMIYSPRSHHHHHPQQQHKRHHSPSCSSSSTVSSLHCLGRSVNTIQYHTLTPPPTWAEIRHHNLLLADSIHWKLKRNISLHLLEGSHNNSTLMLSSLPIGTASISIREVSNYIPPLPSSMQSHQQQQRLKQKEGHMERRAFRRPVTECSIHVQRPVEGGVLEIYAKDDGSTTDHQIKRDEATSNNTPRWMEHTFASAAEAAQFQLDLTALQVLGPTVHNMYQALAMIHQGSEAYVGNEPVLHYQQPSVPSDDNDDDRNRLVTAEDSGIAWDDVMRCLGCSFPSIRLRLEAMWWLKINGAMLSQSEKASKSNDRDSKTMKNPDSEDGEIANTKFLAPEYANERLLLGPVDFFRLFVPKLPDTAVPEAESSRKRVENMLRRRKRVARASVLVQAYVRARMVANRGWKIGKNIVMPDNYLKRRLAFDENADNKLHDNKVRNQYYEATTSRDVICQVRGVEHVKSYYWWKPSLDEVPAAMSLYQAYTLVGMHAFHWPRNDKSLPLYHKKDPVMSIPSLRELIESNPDLHFHVNAMFIESQQAAVFQVYVRSLPRGIDPKFDTVIDRYVKGDEALRDRKLEVVLQLAVGEDRLSFLGRCLLWWMSFLIRLSFHRHIHVPRAASSNDRTSIPALNVSELGDTCHFGGALQTDVNMPKNYVANTLFIGSQTHNNFVARMILSYIEYRGLFGSVSDTTFILAGEQEDELPERALCTIRAVHSKLNTLPMPCLSPNFNTSEATVDLKAIEPVQVPDKGIASFCFKIFVTDPAVATVSSIVRSISGLRWFSSQLLPHSGADTQQSSLEEEKGSDRASIDASATDPFEKAVNELVKILEDVKVPIRKERATDLGISLTKGASTAPLSVPESIASAPPTTSPPTVDFVQTSILRTLSRQDILRYFIASNCSLKTASVRLVESAMWRGLTFPIDIKTCRVELQSGQFFQQGIDLDGNPVFYFRNTCLGPWRKDEDAVIAAVLHRLESSLVAFSKDNPVVQFTLIVTMGRPYRRKNRKRKEKKSITDKSVTGAKADSSVVTMEQATTTSATAAETLTADGGGVEDDEDDDDDEEETAVDENDDFDEAVKLAERNNPRIDPEEQWNMHTTLSLIERLVDIVMTHYPERLSKALVVIRHGNSKYVRTAVGGVVSLASLVGSSRTRDKVRFLRRYRDLQAYVDPSELVTMVGGTLIENLDNYECQ